MRSLNVSGIRSALVLVAHPDDETIWMGGTILSNPHIDWTVYAMSRARDKDRAPKFRTTCKYYGAKSIIDNLEDEGIMDVRAGALAARRLMRKRLAKKSFDGVFSHGYNGEYGHPRHVGIHRAMRAAIRGGEITCKAVYGFAYIYDEKKRYALPRPHASFSVDLSPKIFHAKQSIIRNIYGFPASSFEYKSCANRETFTRNSQK